MSNYYNITENEMNSFLSPQGFQKLSLPNTDEIVYGKRVDNNGIKLSLRVYTGINPSGDSRKVGADAIRVNSFTKTNEGEVKKVASSKRVNRVEGWKKNLSARLEEILAKIPSETCQHCGNLMVVREGKSKEKGTPYKFHGCLNFPLCRGTKPY
jgi:predicted RNA-binding Zn-ribbon protein involved in translation (DUF1610 family)